MEKHGHKGAIDLKEAKKIIADQGKTDVLPKDLILKALIKLLASIDALAWPLRGKQFCLLRIVYQGSRAHGIALDPWLIS